MQRDKDMKPVMNEDSGASSGICSGRSSRKSSTTNSDEIELEDTDSIDTSPHHTRLGTSSENNYRNGVLIGNWFENAADINIRRTDKKLPSDVSLDCFKLL
jgi:hypothetical protein